MLVRLRKEQLAPGGSDLEHTQGVRLSFLLRYFLIFLGGNLENVALMQTQTL